MKNFAGLITALDQTSKTKVKLAALLNYFEQTTDQDKLWAVALFTHRRPKRQVNTTKLREWAAAYAQLPLWLFEDSYHIVGDLAETIALILPKPKSTSNKSLSDWIQYLIQLKGKDDEWKQQKVIEAWQQLNKTERFVFNKLITGGWRIGVSQNLTVQALATYTEKEPAEISHRLMGNWSPETDSFNRLMYEENLQIDQSKPYPFYLAYPLEDEPQKLGDANNWQAEWKWDGIRSQLIKRGGEIYIWSRGEDLITAKFPEFQLIKNDLPNGLAIDGELMPFKEGKPLSFQNLQTRIGRKNVTKKILNDCPVIIMAYDLLEFESKDIRQKPLSERRKKLEQVIQQVNKPGFLRTSEIVNAGNWTFLKEQRQKARSLHNEGLMLKLKSSTYKTGRKRGEWWKWKVDPFSIDGVLIYAMRGHGRRANLYTDYTFGVWDGDKLVSFAKAYSGLTDAEFVEVDRFVKRNTLERYGPVRTVKPELWRKDKLTKEANTLQDLQNMLTLYG